MAEEKTVRKLNYVLFLLERYEPSEKIQNLTLEEVIALREELLLKNFRNVLKVGELNRARQVSRFNISVFTKKVTRAKIRKQPKHVFKPLESAVKPKNKKPRVVRFSEKLVEEKIFEDFVLPKETNNNSYVTTTTPTTTSLPLFEARKRVETLRREMGPASFKLCLLLKKAQHNTDKTLKKHQEYLSTIEQLTKEVESYKPHREEHDTSV